MAGSSWPALVAGAKARASDVESKFDWIEGNIVPMTGGSQTDAAYDLGTSAARWRNGYFSARVNTPAIGLSDTSFISFDATGTITANKPMKMTSGVAIDEFSIDGTLAGNSDLAVPTEKAVKTYVDSSPFSGVGTTSTLDIGIQVGSGGQTITALSVTSDGGRYVLDFGARFAVTSTAADFAMLIEIVRGPLSATTTAGGDLVPGGFSSIHLIMPAATSSAYTFPLAMHALMSLTSGGYTFYVMANANNVNVPPISWAFTCRKFSA